MARLDCTSVSGSSSCCNYRGIFYRKDTNQLLIDENNREKVYSSDSGLTTLTETADFSSIDGYARGLTYFNGRIFVGSENSQLIIIQDGSSTPTPYDNICSSSYSYIQSIYVYKMKYILATCDLGKQVRVFEPNW